MCCSLMVTFKPPDAIKWAPDVSSAHRTSTQRMIFGKDHWTQATGRSPASDAMGASVVNHQTHNTRLTHVTVRGSGVYTLESTTHRTLWARPVQRPMSPRTALGEYFSSEKHSGDISKLSTDAIENMYFIFSNAQTPLYPRNSTFFANVQTTPSVHHHVQVC